MRTKVVGVTFCNEDGSSRAKIIASMNESDTICLERDPYNQYDANAVKVCVIKDGEKKPIGYLSRDVASDISVKLRRNVEFSTSIVGVGIWNDRPFCEIEIKESTSNIQPEDITDQPRTATGPSFNPNKISGPTFVPPGRSGNK